MLLRLQPAELSGIGLTRDIIISYAGLLKAMHRMRRADRNGQMVEPIQMAEARLRLFFMSRAA